MLSIFARSALIVILGGLMVAGAWLLANHFENPDDDLRAGIRESLAEAYGRNPGRTVDLSDIVDRRWDRLYVFGPLTPREAIDRAIAPAELHDSRDLVPADRSLVVLTEGRRVVESAAVSRTPIDVSCATGGEGRALVPGDQPEIVRTTVAGAPRLAATDSGEAAARRCLAGLPPAP